MLRELKYRILIASIIGVVIMATLMLIKPDKSKIVYANGLLSTTSLLSEGSLIKE